MTLILFHAVQVYRGQLGGIFCLELASRSVLKTGKKKKKIKPDLCSDCWIWIKLMSIETGNLCIFLDERCLFLPKKRRRRSSDDSCYSSTYWILESRRSATHHDGEARHRVGRMQLKRTLERKNAAISMGHYKASLTVVWKWKAFCSCLAIHERQNEFRIGRKRKRTLFS